VHHAYSIALVIIVASVMATPFIPEAPKGLVANRTLEKASDAFFSYDIIKYPAYVNITNSFSGTPFIGINAETKALDFGIIFPNSTSKRQINLTSKDDKASHVIFKSYGPIRSMISFNESEFLLQGRKSVYVTVNSGDSAPGYYNGEVDVIVQRSNNEIARRFLGF
jgi:hypothetical protein